MSFLRGIGIQRYKLVYSVHVLDGGNNREKACYIIIFNKISKLKTQWSKLRPTCDKKNHLILLLIVLNITILTNQTNKRTFNIVKLKILK